LEYEGPAKEKAREVLPQILETLTKQGTLAALRMLLHHFLLDLAFDRVRLVARRRE